MSSEPQGDPDDINSYTGHALYDGWIAFGNDEMAQVEAAFDQWDDELHARQVKATAAWITANGVDVHTGTGWDYAAPPVDERILWWDGGDRPTLYFPKKVEGYDAEQDAAWALSVMAVRLNMPFASVLRDAAETRHPLEILAGIEEDCDCQTGDNVGEWVRLSTGDDDDDGEYRCPACGREFWA